MRSTGIAVVATHPPRRCGIATFSLDLIAALRLADPGIAVKVAAIEEPGVRYSYGDDVRWRVRQGDAQSFRDLADAINESDVVAGSMSIPGEGHTDAVLWQNGRITDLGLLPGEGGIFTDASGINKTNEVAGSGDNRESMERAWVWRNGTMTDIGTLGGPQAAAYAINNAGQIVGFAQTSTDADHGYVFAGGKMTDLGLNIFPYAINNNGVIVGPGAAAARSSSAAAPVRTSRT